MSGFDALNLWDGCLISIAATCKLAQGHIIAFVKRRPIRGDRGLACILAAGGLPQGHIIALIKWRPVGRDGRVVLIGGSLWGCEDTGWLAQRVGNNFCSSCHQAGGKQEYKRQRSRQNHSTNVHGFFLSISKA